jgi:hypothetical protein
MGKRKGKITMDFVSADDLDRLVAAITAPAPVASASGPTTKAGQTGADA